MPRVVSDSISVRTLAVLLIAGAVSGRPVRAQCSAEWADGFGPIRTYVKAFAVYDDGTGPKLVAGGRFTRSGGVGLSHVAVWNGFAWRPIGGGFAGISLPNTGTGTEVLALTAFDDGTGPALYAGGNFLTAGGVVVNGVAKWNGSTWSPLGSGIAGEVRTLAVYDDGSGPALYAGGEFTSAGGVAAASVAKWNGVAWSALGSGLGGSFCQSGTGAAFGANAMAAYDDGAGPALFVTGYFTTAGGLSCNAIAKWNGAAWSPVGTGLAQVQFGFTLCGYGSALVVFDDGMGPALFVGGYFQSIWGVPTSGLARWSQSGWSTPNLTGLTLSGILSLAVHDDGTGPALYAAGAGVAKRAGPGGWISLGAPSNQTVFAIASFPTGGGSALAAGGRKFEHAGAALPVRRKVGWRHLGRDRRRVPPSRRRADQLRGRLRDVRRWHRAGSDRRRLVPVGGRHRCTVHRAAPR